MSQLFLEEEDEALRRDIRDSFQLMNKTFALCARCGVVKSSQRGFASTVTLINAGNNTRLENMIAASIQPETMLGTRCSAEACVQQAVRNGQTVNNDGEVDVAEGTLRWTELEDLPRCLVFHIPPMVVTGSWISQWFKKDTYKFPLVLDMSPYLRPCQILEQNNIEHPPIPYILSGTFRHHRPQSEHWTAKIRVDTGGQLWVDCNDSEITRIQRDAVFSDRPHNLFYDCWDWDAVCDTMDLYNEFVRKQKESSSENWREESLPILFG